MSRDPNLPDGFISILDARARLGRALYGRRWSNIEKASEDQRTLGGLVMFAVRIHADEETIRSIGGDLAEAAGKSWKYRSRTVTELLERLQSGALRGYLFRSSRLPELQPREAWRDQAFVDALSSGCIEHGGAGQRQPTHVIVREGDLRPVLAALEAPKPEATEQPPESQPRLAQRRKQLRMWLEETTQQEMRRGHTKAALLGRARREVDENISLRLFREVWRISDIPIELRRGGRRPSD